MSAHPQPRFDLYIQAGNSRSPAVGGERAAIGGSIRNVLFGGAVLSAEYGATEGLQDAFAAYSAPIFDPRTTIDVRFEMNEADVVEPALQALGIQSESAAGEVGLTRKVVQRPLTPDGDGWIAARAISLGARLSRRESETSLLGVPFSFAPGAVDGRTEVTALRFTGDWIERGINEVWAASAVASVGLDGTRSDAPGVPSPDQNFTSVLAQLNYARRLTDRLEVRARVAGQWASGLLYTSERSP